jgi:hypothetical protein
MAIAKFHHLVYGRLNDYLTGEELVDTDDERIRQGLARMMVEEKGYPRSSLVPRLKIDTFFSRCFVTSTLDLTVSLAGRQVLVLRYGPGSLVSRERAAIAAARVLNPEYRIPLAVVTNGREAELLATSTGKILGYGVESIPDYPDLEKDLVQLPFLPPPLGLARERELRILNAFDVERCCL